MFLGHSILEGTNPSNDHLFLPDQFAVEFSPETPQCQASRPISLGFWPPHEWDMFFFGPMALICSS